MNKCKYSIKYKYPLYIFIVSTFIAVLSIITSSIFFYNILKKDFLEETNSLYNKLKPKILYSIKNLQYLDLANKLSYLVNTKEINGIVILDENNNILIKKGIKKGLIIKKEFPHGKLIVYFSKAFLRNLIKEMVIRMLFVFILIIPLIVIFTYLLTKLQLKNFFTLSNIIKKIGNPEFSNYKDFSLKGNDEIAKLGEILKSKHLQLIASSKQLYLLHKTIEQCYNSIVITDVNGEILYVNSAFSRMTGYTKEEVIGKNPRILKSRKQSEEFYENLWNTILSGNIWEGKLVNKTKDGDFYIEKMIITPVKDDNKIEYFIAVKQDITKEIEYEKKLIRMEKMKTVELMASGIAHEINNILATVVSYPEILKYSIENKNTLIKGLNKIHAAGLKISDILVELTSLSSNIALPKQKVDINEIIIDCIDSDEIKELFKEKKVKVKLQLSDNIALIKGNYAYIYKSFINLLKNAYEAIEDSGNIVLKTENINIDYSFAQKHEISSGKYVKCSIFDSGKGISSEDIERVFEPFFTKKKLGRKSTGVGLTIVWNTLKLHNGTIIVKSNENGTEFQLYFPATARQTEQMKKTISTNKKYSILVVDDEETQREIMSKILENNNFVVFTASSGEEAIDFLKNNNVDIVILDMIMGHGIDGCETFERIKSFKPFQKAIIISGMSYSERINKALNLGIKNYIKKPYTVKQLLNIIKATIESD